ncbi:MAG: 1-deoxy-D-xylulose-5-phosphate reductoisomerase, partial [Muribaculaceae bacterium]|nr:1-deoxy-D-xylulose-5-phosphate reductoisomerase [Muribaculaceae bacterium]
AFEIIEAHWLIEVPAEKIMPVVHPQSIVHSMVEFIDGSVKAQLGVPDMRLPIRYALGEAQRLETTDSPLTLDRMVNLTFERPDAEKFPAIKLAQYSLSRGGNTACVVNAANEIAVAAFLKGFISFPAIYDTIERTLGAIEFIATPTFDDYVATNSAARAYAQSIIPGL